MQAVSDLPRLPPRPTDGNKGRFGRVLVLAGSRGMAGAAILCGSAALRGGAGLVRVAGPAENLPLVAVGNPCYMTVPLPQDASGRLSYLARDPLLQLARENDVLAVGPGLGRSPALARLLADALGQIDRPVVLDADGLNAFVGQVEKLGHQPGPRILTPHPGEFARLLDTTVTIVQERRAELAGNLARAQNVVVVLKGHGTIVTDGRRCYVNDTGNPGLATGGTGDVLTGLIAALVGQGLDAFGAAQLGVHIHGLAGDLVRDDLGEISLTALDLPAYLPRAFRNLGY